MEEQDSGSTGGNGYQSAGTSARSAARRLRRDGEELYDSARSAVIESAEARKDDAGSYMRDLSGAIEAGAEELDRRGRPHTASWAGWLAGEVGRAGESLAERGLDELWGEAASLAQRRPALVAGAALLVGFGLVRFIMSAPESDSDDQPPPGGNVAEE